MVVSAAYFRMITELWWDVKWFVQREKRNKCVFVRVFGSTFYMQLKIEIFSLRSTQEVPTPKISHL